MKVAFQKAVVGTLIVLAAVSAALFGPLLFGKSATTELTTQTPAAGSQQAPPVETSTPMPTATPVPAAILVTTPPTPTAVPLPATVTPVPSVAAPDPLPTATSQPVAVATPEPDSTPGQSPSLERAPIELATVEPTETPSPTVTAVETTASTPEPTPTDVVVVEPTPEPTPTEVVVVEPTPTQAPEPTVTTTPTPTPTPTTAAVEPDTTETVAAAWLYVSSTDGLFLRDVPAGQIVDVLTYRTEVHITGNVLVVGERTWAEVDVPGTGWVALSFLDTEQPAPPPDPVPTGPSEPPTAADWEAFRQCESGGRYDVVDPSGLYHGAYQFLPSTWDGLVRRFWPELVGVLPSQAAPQDQDKVAMKLFELEGARPWPTCGRYLL